MSATLRRAGLMTSLLAFSFFGQAAGDARLTFHMGAGAQESFFIGGTIENKGDSAIDGGYVVVVPVTETCTPQKPVMATFGVIEPGEKTQFRVPVDSKLHGYRLAGFAAWDDMGYALPATDESVKIIKEREPEERKNCILKRAENKEKKE